LDTYPDDHCIPNFEGDCDTPPILEESNVEIDIVENESVTLIEKCVEDYIKSVPPEYCNIYERDITTGEYIEDVDFEENYMSCAVGTSDCLSKVYKRDVNFYNEDCDYAEDVFNNNTPNQQGSSYFFNYYGGDTINNLLDSNNRGVVYTNTNSNVTFQNTLHKGALFYKINKNNRSKIIFEVTKKSS
jgi:hypothetical protein